VRRPGGAVTEPGEVAARLQQKCGAGVWTRTERSVRTPVQRRERHGAQHEAVIVVACGRGAWSSG